MGYSTSTANHKFVVTIDQKLKDAQSSTNQVGAKILLKGTTNPENSRRKSCWESYRM
ncbi:hypothetical protein ACS0TY_033289 [Phlomoides rotata]